MNETNKKPAAKKLTLRQRQAVCAHERRITMLTYWVCTCCEAVVDA